MIETDRLLLRPWRETDALCLYAFAKEPQVGEMAGWQHHKNLQDSLDIIRLILSKEGNYAVALKDYESCPIGSIGLMQPKESNLDIPAGEVELGYWIGKPFWGMGYMTEAVRAIQKWAFNELKVEGIWCGYFEGNYPSQRVQEKCNFRFQHTERNLYFPLLKGHRTLHCSRISKSEWRMLQEKNHPYLGEL